MRGAQGLRASDPPEEKPELKEMSRVGHQWDP